MIKNNNERLPPFVSRPVLLCGFLSPLNDLTSHDNIPNSPSPQQQQRVCSVTEYPNHMDKKYDSVRAHSIFMSSSEKILFSLYLKNSTVYYEYGTGGSTTFACSLLSLSSSASSSIDSNLQTIFSIESDQEFITNLIDQSDCLQANLQQHFYPVYPSIGPIKGFGYPIRNPNLILESQMNLWLSYPQSILTLVKRYKLPPDFVLIDGRFRVASALFTLLVLPSDSIIAIHDFSPRPQYYTILKYYEPIECVNSLLIAKQKEKINWKEFYEDLNHYLNDPD
jgi:hypothetical protein